MNEAASWESGSIDDEASNLGEEKDEDEVEASEEEDDFLQPKKGVKRNIEDIEVADRPLYSNKALKKIKVEGHSKGQNIQKFDNDGQAISNLEFDRKY
jgi:hypothetical protein